MKTVLGFAAVLLVLALGWSSLGDREPSSAGAPARSQTRDSGPLGNADGYVAVGASLSPFSSEPALAKLDPALREALLEAAGDAGAEGVELRVNGGWRSARYQRALLGRAVETYGSVEAARQYVMPPGESSHVTGEAVDVGPADAAAWLTRSGSAYGLCQVYANEPWHFELATEPGGACPPLTASAAEG